MYMIGNHLRQALVVIYVLYWAVYIEHVFTAVDHRQRQMGMT